MGTQQPRRDSQSQENLDGLLENVAVISQAFSPYLRTTQSGGPYQTMSSSSRVPNQTRAFSPASSEAESDSEITLLGPAIVRIIGRENIIADMEDMVREQRFMERFLQSLREFDVLLTAYLLFIAFLVVIVLGSSVLCAFTSVC
ncbi:hypothetical protein V8F20_003915 [Naviculisporaceae sp. PSN 640]